MGVMRRASGRTDTKEMRNFL